MAKKGTGRRKSCGEGDIRGERFVSDEPLFLPAASTSALTGKSSPLIDTRVIHCGDNLEQLAKLPNPRETKERRGAVRDVNGPNIRTITSRVMTTSGASR